MEEKKCKTCAYFMQHYVLAENRFLRVNCGHCTCNTIRRKRPDDRACEKHVEGESDEAAFVTQPYLSKALLARLLTMPLLPEIGTLDEVIK